MKRKEPRRLSRANLGRETLGTRLPIPDHDSVTWRVWDIGRARPLFRARLYARDRLLDARGDFVLVRRLDEFDVPRAVVSQLRSVPIQH